MSGPVVVCAPDSFKESMDAATAARVMAEGVRDVHPDADCRLFPMADGGEGFVEAVAASLDADLRTVTVSGALGMPTQARFAIAGELAVLEVAQAVGLGLLPTGARDIMRASTRGVGEMLRMALDAGARRVVVGLGGSSTNDGGAGMLAALGVRFVDAAGDEVDPLPGELHRVQRMDASGLDARLGDVEVTIASDVDNPLLGPRGASAVFGPQKGAAPGQVAQLDRLLQHLATVCGRLEDAGRAGAGAAGGLGWALLAFLDAAMRPGVQVVAEITGLADAVRGADLVLTGEGSLDAQTLSGKTPAGVAGIAARAGVACVALAGRVAPDADVLLGHGIAALVPVVPGAVDLDEALRDGPVNLRRATATVMRLRALR